METELKVHPFYCTQSKSSSFRIEIKYPQISNLSYSFQLNLQIFLQTLIPKINYNLVHQQTFHLPKTQVIIQNLQPTKMYKVQISWNKKGNSIKQNIKSEKIVFACSQKIPQNQLSDENQQNQVQDSVYGQFVKDNIQGYFEQYYHDSSLNNPISNSLNNKNNSKISSVQQSKYKYSSKNKIRPVPKTPFCNTQSLMKVIGESDPFINKKNLQKYILEGRNSSSVKDYLTTKDFQCFNSCNKIYKNQSERRKHVEKTLLVSKAMNMFGQIYSFEKQHDILSETNYLNKNNDEQRKGRQFFNNDWFMGPFYSYNGNERQMKKRDQENAQQTIK